MALHGGGQGWACALGRRAKGGAKRGGEKKNYLTNTKFLKKISLLQKFFAASPQVILKILQENFGIVKKTFLQALKIIFKISIFEGIIFLHIGKIASFQDFFFFGGGGHQSDCLPWGATYPCYATA